LKVGCRTWPCYEALERYWRTTAFSRKIGICQVLYCRTVVSFPDLMRLDLWVVDLIYGIECLFRKPNWLWAKIVFLIFIFLSFITEFIRFRVLRRLFIIIGSKYYTKVIYIYTPYIKMYYTKNFDKNGIGKQNLGVQINWENIWTKP